MSVGPANPIDWGGLLWAPSDPSIKVSSLISLWIAITLDERDAIDAVSTPCTGEFVDDVVVRR